MPYIDSHLQQQITRDLAGFTITELAALGRTFVVDTDTHWPNLVEPSTGARIMLSLVQGNADRVQVVGSYPENRLWDLPRYAATVARDRGPRAVAKAIVSKILDAGYLTVLDRITESNAADEDAAKARTALATRLADLMPAGAAFEDTTSRDTGMNLRFHYSGTYGDVRLSYRADSVHMDLHGLTPEQAEAIASILKES